MITLAEMKENIAQALYSFSAYELPNICTKLGLEGGDSSEAFSSKKSICEKKGSLAII